MTMHRKVLWTLTIFSAVLTVGCAVEEEGRTDNEVDTGVETQDPCREYDTLMRSDAADFELGIATGWWVSSDGTGQMSQLPGREPSATEIDGGRCGISRYALCLSAQDMAVFGGAIGVNFTPAPFNASDWDGVVFFAKRTEASNRSLYFALSDRYTDENDGAKLNPDGVPFCEEMPEDPSLKCDRFGVGVGLETQWRMYRIPFEDFHQRGFGMEAPELDVGAIIGINISFDVGDWEFCIDDIAYYRDDKN